MKSVNYSLMRTICALVIGLVLVLFPAQAGEYLVLTVGIVFMVPSLITLIGYFARKSEGRFRFPVEALGSLLFGLWLVIMPGCSWRLVGGCPCREVSTWCPCSFCWRGWCRCSILRAPALRCLSSSASRAFAMPLANC